MQATLVFFFLTALCCSYDEEVKEVNRLAESGWFNKMATANKRLFLTGASGLLGRAIYKKFVNEGWTVYGTAYSR